MQSAVIYSALTRPEMILGVNKDALPLFAIFFGIFMIIKIIFEFMTYIDAIDFSISMLWLVPLTGVLHLVFFITGKVDPFYFTIDRKFNRLRTKQFNQNKGNLYVS